MDKKAKPYEPTVQIGSQSARERDFGQKRATKLELAQFDERRSMQDF